MCNISKHNNIIQYINIENMGDREGIYFRLIHYMVPGTEMITSHYIPVISTF